MSACILTLQCRVVCRVPTVTSKCHWNGTTPCSISNMPTRLTCDGFHHTVGSLGDLLIDGNAQHLSGDPVQGSVNKKSQIRQCKTTGSRSKWSRAGCDSRNFVNIITGNNDSLNDGYVFRVQTWSSSEQPGLSSHHLTFRDRKPLCTDAWSCTSPLRPWCPLHTRRSLRAKPSTWEQHMWNDTTQAFPYL